MARPRKVIRTKTLYKRRRFPRKATARILFVLLILVLIGVGFIVMQEWSKRFGPNAPKPSPSSTQSVESVPLPSSSQEEVSSKEEAPQAIAQKSAFVSAQTLMQNATTLDSLMNGFKTAGYTAVTVELKGINGMLCYKSAVSDAVKYGVIEPNAVAITDIVAAANNAGLVPVAQISAFKDQSIAHVSRENSFAYSDQLKTNWLDDSVAKGGKAWLNPYMPNARKYICDIAAEISKAGFKSITVQNVMFPDKNTKSMNTIITEPSREEILRQAISEIKTAVGDTNVLIVTDMAKSAAQVGENPLKTAVGNMYVTGTLPALYISLADIEANKKAICLNAAIVDQNGYDPSISVGKVVEGVVSQLSPGTVEVLEKPAVILSQADYEIIKDVLTGLDIKNITIIQ